MKRALRFVIAVLLGVLWFAFASTSHAQSVSVSAIKELTPVAAKDTPPTTLWITQDVTVTSLRPQDQWHVAQKPSRLMTIRGELDDGITDCDSREITLRLGQTELEMRRSLTHQALHAITFCDATKMNSKTERAHEGIYWLEPRLTWVLMHNPDLLRYLGGQSIVPEYDQPVR